MQYFDDCDCGLDLSLNINTPILQFFKEKPITASIPQFFPVKNLHKSHKSCYQSIPLIHDPSECDSFRETIGKNSPKSRQNVLLLCIFTHDHKFLEKIIKEKPLLEVNEVDSQGNSPLMLAVKLAYRHLDYYKIIRVLLENGANPSFKDLKGFSILEEALAQVFWLIFLKLGFLNFFQQKKNVWFFWKKMHVFFCFKNLFFEFL